MEKQDRNCRSRMEKTKEEQKTIRKRVEQTACTHPEEEEEEEEEEENHHQ